MSTIRKRQPTPPSGMRKVTVYGEVPGTGAIVDEMDDGAMVSVVMPKITAQVQLNAKNLMDFTRQLADLFGHDVVLMSEWRDKIFRIITTVCERNESRCLDDDVDRSVVVSELVEALAAAVAPAKSRQR